MATPSIVARGGFTSHRNKRKVKFDEDGKAKKLATERGSGNAGTRRTNR